MKTCRFEILGAGVVNHHISEALFSNELVASSVLGIDVFDAKLVRPSPVLPFWLRGYGSRPKAVCLGDRISAILGRPIPGKAYRQFVENVDWQHLWTFNAGGKPDFIFVLMGLDCWPSRVSAMSDIRQAGSRVDSEILVIQAAVDKEQAQVSVFGNSLSDDPCAACGLLSLPASEPCLVLRECGRLLRGTLRSEASAAAAQVLTVIIDCLTTGNSTRWRNTKINLTACPGAGRYETTVRKRTRVPGCWGPHTADAPMRQEALLSD
jgi:hypothetical protein